MVLKTDSVVLLSVGGGGSNSASMPWRRSQTLIWVLHVLWNGAHNRFWQLSTWQSRVTECVHEHRDFLYSCRRLQTLPKNILLRNENGGGHMIKSNPQISVKSFKVSMAAIQMGANGIWPGRQSMSGLDQLAALIPYAQSCQGGRHRPHHDEAFNSAAATMGLKVSWPRHSQCPANDCSAVLSELPGTLWLKYQLVFNTFFFITQCAYE